MGAVLLIVGGIGGAGLYRHIAASLPDYRWLADYEPPQMSRVYASDSRLQAELAFRTRDYASASRLFEQLASRGTTAARLDAALFARRAGFFAAQPRSP